MSTLFWSAALIVGVLWPGRLIGLLDGAPFDTPVQALLLAMALPALWFLAPSFLKTRLARGLIGALVAWKIAGWFLLTQGGLCATFLAAPEPGAAMQVQPSWDVRTLWSPRSGCSAVMTRPYAQFEDFPAWTINILPESMRPPGGMFALKVTGVAVTKSGDVRPVSFETSLQGSGWHFVPQLDGEDLFTTTSTYVTTPTTVDRVFSGWAAWITPVIEGLLLAGWAAFAFRALAPTTPTIVWTTVASAVAFLLGASVEPPLVRFTMLGLTLVLLLPLRAAPTVRTAFLLAGLPWLAFFAGRSVHDIGHFMVYTSGDDWWTFQRHAYEIFMQGFWLEGGEKTFWNQPLYRWTAGLLHLVFGDSSAGEMYLDAAGITAGAMFAFYAVSRVAPIRFALAAPLLVFNVAMLGPNWYGIGRGLSEISAALCVYLAAFALCRAREGEWRHVLLAGLFGALAFFTRLNHLVLLLALVLLLVPEATDAGSAIRIPEIWNRLPKARSAVYLACIALAVLTITLRTWYYTGHFSLFLGTQRDLVSTGLGPSTLFSGAAWRRGLESVAMIATVQDPPRVDIRGVVVTAGAIFATLGLAAVPVLRRLPFGLAVFCVAAAAGGLFVRGSAYAGRFSVQLVPVAVAVAVCSFALALGRRRVGDEVFHE